MKKKALLASILTIALCFGAIAGSTYALFTDSKSVNIAVTSGDVEVYAELSIAGLWSASATNGAAEDIYLIDEYGHNYVHEEKVDNFTNGGTAIPSGANVNVYKITPGDKVGVNIKVKNTGDVAMKYRYVVKVDGDNPDSEILAENMVFTDHANNSWIMKYIGEAYYSGWFEDEPDSTEFNTQTVTFELPVYAGNDCQTEYGDGTVKSVTFTITVEAVQANASTIDGGLHSNTTITPADPNANP